MIRAEVINHNNGKKQGFRSGSVFPYQFVWAADFINEVENNPLHRSEYIIYEAIKALASIAGIDPEPREFGYRYATENFEYWSPAMLELFSELVGTQLI